HVRYAVFYLLCGAAAGATHALTAVHSSVPVVGASGAIAGVSGAYFLFFPTSRAVTILPIFLFIQIVEIPAVFFLLICFVCQVAKEAQVSKALIFWHFESKEKLFRTALQRTLEPYFINVVDDLEGLSEVDQSKRLIDQYYAFVSENLYSVKFVVSLLLRDEKH